MNESNVGLGGSYSSEDVRAGGKPSTNACKLAIVRDFPLLTSRIPFDVLLAKIFKNNGRRRFVKRYARL